MCKADDIAILANMDESLVIEFLSGMGYEVIPQNKAKRIEDVLKRSGKLAYDKGRISLHNDIKAVLPNE